MTSPGAFPTLRYEDLESAVEWLVETLGLRGLAGVVGAGSVGGRARKLRS